MKNATLSLLIVASAIALLALPGVSTAADTNWKGTSSANWSDPNNWTAGLPNSALGAAFNASSIGTVITTQDISPLTLLDITVGAVPGTAGANPVSITNFGFKLGASGINLTGSTQDVTINSGVQDISLTATQGWTQPTARTLSVLANHLYLSDSVAAHTLTLTLNSASGTTAITGIIADSSAAGAAPSGLSVTTTGTSNVGANLKLTGNSTYSGGSALAGRATNYQVGSDSTVVAGNVVSGPFGTGAITITNNNQVQQFQAVGGDHSVGNAITLNGGFNFIGAQNLTFTGAITASQGRALTINSSAGANVLLNGDITMGTAAAAAGTLTTSIAATNTTTPVGKFVINGAFKDAVGVTSGAILLLSNGNAANNAITIDQLNGQSTYTGGTNLNGQASTIEVGSSSVVVANNIVSGPLGKGAVNFNNTTVGAAPRILAVGGAQTVANAVNLATGSGAIVQGSNDLTLSGVVAGTGATNNGYINKTGTGTLTLSNANTYAGGTTQFDGGLKLGNKSALGTGGYTIGDASTSSTLKVSSTTNLTAANAVGNAVTVVKDFTVASGSSDLELSGTVALGAVNRTITVDSSNATILSGVISDTGGTGGIIKQGGGVLILTGANTYGTVGVTSTTVSAGKLLVKNTTGSGTGPGNVLVNGGTLGGTGSIAGSVTVSGTGVLSPGASINVLGIGGNLTMTGGSFDYEINRDVAPAVGADLNNVTGNLSLATVALSAADLGVGAVPLAMGTKFTLINYGGTWNGGIFTGLANHSTSLTIGLNRFQIDYDATSGGSNFGGGSVGAGSHFVTITAVPEASTFLTIGLGGIFAIAAVWMTKRMGVNVLKV